MILRDLIEWLENQDPNMLVKDGFGRPHTDRGYCGDLAFDPEGETTFGKMLVHAKLALGNTFEGWRGGDFAMDDWTLCRIGEVGEHGEEITSAHQRLWVLTAVRKELP